MGMVVMNMHLMVEAIQVDDPVTSLDNFLKRHMNGIEFGNVASFIDNIFHKKSQLQSVKKLQFLSAQ